MLSVSRLLAFLSLMGVFASPADLIPKVLYPKSPKFLRWLEFYYSLYNDNGAGAKYTEFDGTGQFQISWDGGLFSVEGDYTLAVYSWTTDPVTECCVYFDAWKQLNLKPGNPVF
ncbi:hypothetical protein P170DRAFT_425350 [Aspergillus steynii IBT 23096]|uniref:Uncharacterized protein n=1 Tax=Aspergillus steynii IBT 23096 TaxID=1392250 RepID=A0A2I2GE01_9EURO|nr:uncharacterized protein P170DRAFT_425350 [Aspergillus steynii IBT 23096]PLB51071.1 hypothetical protein P170DRAFT_425350 [Aspergillus steynii IBT 23096]